MHGTDFSLILMGENSCMVQAVHPARNLWNRLNSYSKIPLQSRKLLHKKGLVVLSRNTKMLIIQAVTQVIMSVIPALWGTYCCMLPNYKNKIFHPSIFHKTSDIYLSTTISNLNCPAASFNSIHLYKHQNYEIKLEETITWLCDRWNYEPDWCAPLKERWPRQDI